MPWRAADAGPGADAGRGAVISAFDRAWERAVWTGPGARGVHDDRAAPSSWPGTSAVFFDLDAWRAHLAQAWTLLDAAEQARVARRHHAVDRDELTLTYALHRLLLARWLHCPPTDVPLQRDALGRPCVAGDALHTSLGHVAGHAAMAVGMRGPLGIDFEPRAQGGRMLDIAERVLHPDEGQLLAGMSDAVRGDALLQLWVRKEALLKAAGIGLAREMSTVAAPIGIALSIPLADGGNGDGQVTLRMLEVGPQWHAALASMPDDKPRTGWISA